jgi:hypothetical protein
MAFTLFDNEKQSFCEATMTAAVYDIHIDKGSHFGLPFKWRDKQGNNLLQPDASFHMQIRDRMIDGTVLLDLSSANGAFTVDAGIVHLQIPAELTSPIQGKKGVYDIEVTQDGRTYRLLKGDVTFSPEVTRD